MNNVKIIAGRSNPTLAKNIADHLQLPLVDCNLTTFSNGEIYAEAKQNIRGSNIYFIQTGSCSADGKRSINDHFVESLAVADLCRRSDVKSVAIICPMFPYSRSDKKDKPRVSIMSAVVADAFKNAGFTRIICIDIHAAQTQGTSTLPFDNLYAINLHIDNLKTTVFNNRTLEEINENFILVAPDMGSIRRIRSYAHKLSMAYTVMDKRRDYTRPNSVAESVLIGGDVRGKTAIIIDDMADTMGTMISAVKDLENNGVKNVIVIVTHGILSSPAIDRINNCELITQVIVTDSIDQSINLTKCDKISVVSIAGLFAEVIKRLSTNESISELFD